jgi:hypothetical protein
LITLKTKDICEALGIKKHQLRACTDLLEPFSSMGTNERSARKYDTGDLLFFAVVFQLESEFGLSIRSMSKYSRSLYETLRSPKNLGKIDRIFVDIESNACSWAEERLLVEQGIVFDPSKAERVVCEYLGVMPSQSNLQFGFSLVS